MSLSHSSNSKEGGPLVSVILNSYNQSVFLNEAIESVLTQTFENLELIIIDNGSTDSSQDIIRTHADKDSRIRPYLFDKNISISKRLNSGVQGAKGKYISFLLSDDFYLPEKLRRQVSVLEADTKEEIGVVYGPHYTLNDVTKDRWISPALGRSGYILEDLLENLNLHLDFITPLSRRSLFLTYPFYEDLFMEGEDWFFRAAMKHKLHYLDTPLTCVRDHMKNAGKATDVNLGFAQISMTRLKESPEFPKHLEPVWEKCMAGWFRDAAFCGMRVGGDPHWARKSVS